MAKDLRSEHKLPTPIGPISTGNAKVDAAIEQLAVFPHSPAYTSTRPVGEDYDQLVKVANTAETSALLKLLATKGLLELGGSAWDDTRYNRLSPAKKEYKKLSEAAATAAKIRLAFVSWLIEAVIPSGFKELLAIVANEKVDAAVRLEALIYLRANSGDNKKKLTEIVKSVDIVGWNGQPHDKSTLVQELIKCWHQLDPKGAYNMLAKLVTPAVAKKRSNLVDAIITSLYRSEVKADPRWPVALGKMVRDQEMDVVSLMALESLPRDPKVMPEILKAFGPLAKVTYIYEGLVEVVARLGTLDTVPVLQRAIELDPEAADKILGMIPSKAKAVIAAVKSKPVVNKEAPSRVRAQLIYKKVKPYKAPKLPPLAKQKAAHQKLFADAGIPDVYKVVQTAVAMLPTRVEEKTLKLGATKLGGHPDLPAGVKWPRVSGEPLTFLAQLNFADFAKLTDELPRSGTLAIFVDDDAVSEAGGYLENARAIYTKVGVKLERREVPEDFVSKIYQACKVELVQTLSLPSPSNAHVTKALDEDTLEKYGADVFADVQLLPKVLGYRDHGYDAEEPATARLLIQFPGDTQTDMEFGDADALSIFIGVKDLAKGNFNKVWPHIGD